MGHILWGVTSQLLIFVSHRSSAFFRVIRLICFVTQLTTVSAPLVFKITSRHEPGTENTAALLLNAILLGFPRGRYLATSLVRWPLPSNRKHSSYCCVCIFRAWPRYGRSSIVACMSVAGCLPSRCQAIIRENPSQCIGSYTIYLAL
jgi:hypothetical protein